MQQYLELAGFVNILLLSFKNLKFYRIKETGSRVGTDPEQMWRKAQQR